MILLHYSHHLSAYRACIAILFIWLLKFFLNFVNLAVFPFPCIKISHSQNELQSSWKAYSWLFNSSTELSKADKFIYSNLWRIVHWVEINLIFRWPRNTLTVIFSQSVCPSDVHKTRYAENEAEAFLSFCLCMQEDLET